jgi:hypothetical protein
VAIPILAAPQTQTEIASQIVAARTPTALNTVAAAAGMNTRPLPMVAVGSSFYTESAKVYIQKMTAVTIVVATLSPVR